MFCSWNTSTPSNVGNEAMGTNSNKRLYVSVYKTSSKITPSFCIIEKQDENIDDDDENIFIYFRVMNFCYEKFETFRSQIFLITILSLLIICVTTFLICCIICSIVAIKMYTNYLNS